MYRHTDLRLYYQATFRASQLSVGKSFSDGIGELQGYLEKLESVDAVSLERSFRFDDDDTICCLSIAATCRGKQAHNAVIFSERLCDYIGKVCKTVGFSGFEFDLLRQKLHMTVNGSPAHEVLVSL